MVVGEVTDASFRYMNKPGFGCLRHLFASKWGDWGV